jgi:hypothetical protein
MDKNLVIGANYSQNVALEIVILKMSILPVTAECDTANYFRVKWRLVYEI